MKKSISALLLLLLFSLYGCTGNLATHTHGDLTGYWSLFADSNDSMDRIYSGTGETVLLSVAIINPTGSRAKVEILVNGLSVINGVLEKELGIDGRTWKLKDVKTIDITAKDSTVNVSGHYVISVPL